MIIPDKVKIGGLTYRVVRMDEIADDRDVDGQCLYTKGLIQLKSSNSLFADYDNEVFLHELIHAIFNMLGFEQNEDKVERLAQALHQVIVDNPEVFA